LKVGRPTKYNADILALANEYIDNYQEHDDVAPTAAGMACAIGVSKKTLYVWAEEHEEFLHTLSELQSKQEKVLISKGLSSEFNSTITKLMLANHGYHEKTETQSTMTVSIDNADAKTL
jgi:hypothetical protein